MPSYASLMTLIQRSMPWLMAAVFSALIVWQLLPLLTHKTVSSITSSDSRQTDINTLHQQILASNLFGEENANETPDVAATTQTTQLTSLPYTLKGIISGTNATSGGAIIEIAPGDSSYFSAGGNISSTITLAEVHHDHVVINNQGRKELLRLADLSLSMASAATTSANSFSNGMPPSPSLQPDRDNPDRSESSPNNTLDPEDIINRDRIRQRLEELRARNPS